MNRRHYAQLIVSGLCCGVLLSFTYINPYQPPIRLTELLLQLSGSRGEFALGISPVELLSFQARLLPCLLFESLVGVHLYRHFCTASIYVFSRTPNRVLWYFRECAAILLAIALYQTAYLSSAIMAAHCRYEVVWETAGVKILLMHAFLYGLWLFAMTLLINLLSIRFGSETAFTVTFGGQAVWIVLLASLRLWENNAKIYSFLLNANPVSHLVIGWHSEAISLAAFSVPGIEHTLSFSSSFVLLWVIAAAIGAAGLLFVQKQDLLVADAEYGGN